MCNLGQEIREQGRMEGMAEIIMSMYQKGFFLKANSGYCQKDHRRSKGDY